HYDGSGTFDFNPDFFQAGVYNITFFVSDGVLLDSEVVAITVANVNRPPELASVGNQTVDENSNLNFTVSATDPDLNDPALSTSTLPDNATFSDNGDGTGVFDFTPSFYQAGTYNVTFYADDGEAVDSETVVITVYNVNQPPVLNSIGPQFVTEGENLNFTVTTSDADSTLLALSAAPLPPNATFTDNGNGTGVFDFNPDYTQADIISLVFYVDDGEDVDSELVFITISEAGNQAPVISPIGPQTVIEGDNLSFGVSATDPDLDSLILTAENVPPNATFTDNFNGTGTFDFNPDYTQAGVYNVTFIASDGALADTEVVAITVNESGNQAPELAAIGAQSVTEGDNLNIGVSATDLDLDSLILSAENVPVNASFTDHYDGTGTFDFNPDFTQSGTYYVTFKAFDGVDLDSEVVEITVFNSNRPPMADAGPDQADIPVGTIVTLDGTGSSDPDADNLGFNWVQVGGPAVTLSSPTDSMPAFTPMEPELYLFELTVDDGDLFSDPDTVRITVINVAPPESITDLTIAIIGDNVELSWSAVTLDTSGLSTVIAAYIIYRDTIAYFTPEADDSVGATGAVTLAFTDNNISADVVGDTLLNYFYVVVSRDVYGNQSDVSNRVGEFDYQIVTTGTTDYNLVCVPFENTGIATADDLIDSIGRDDVLTVNNYQPASQGFESRFAAGFGVNFTVVPGGIYQVNAAASTVFSVAGSIPDPGIITYPLVTTGTTNYSFLSIPFERASDFVTAQDVLDNLPGSFYTLNHFVAASQSYQSRFAAGFGTNFPVRAGKPYQANAASDDVFPGP
ncbi:MAG: tandem-95 repeat protein, partial [candidate division Zixibacteria bacterium]|nr:tandem-95 repeat protein [candidate division Zixibacteria bacterium]